MLNEVQLALGSDTAGSVRGMSIKYASFITPTVILCLSLCASSGCQMLTTSLPLLTSMCVFATRMHTISVPASYCGVFGMRPTHGRVSLRGAVPLAESFDTPGLLARDIDMLASGMHALLRSEACSSGPNAPRFDGWKVARDCFDLADKSVASAIYDAVVSRKELWVGALGELSEISIGDDVTRNSSSSHPSSSVTPSTSIPARHGGWTQRRAPCLLNDIAEKNQEQTVAQVLR